MPRSKNLLGIKFGRLSPLELVGIDKFNRNLWKCLCDCGNYHTTNSGSLINGVVVSCGCYHKEQASKQHRKSLGKANFNRLYEKYKGGAKRRKLEFSLSKEEFRKLTLGNCIYCGKEPSQIFNYKGSYGTYTYNGVDRKNNSVGYVIENCASCCGICNERKGSMNYDEFILWIKMVYNNTNE